MIERIGHIAKKTSSPQSSENDFRLNDIIVSIASSDFFYQTIPIYSIEADLLATRLPLSGKYNDVKFRFNFAENMD